MKYDIKIYHDEGITPGSHGLHQVVEMETIRDLTYAQKTVIVSVLERHKILFTVLKVE